MTSHIGVQWAGRDLRGMSLRGAVLCGSNLRGVRMEDVDLRDSDLWGANLSLASLRRADMRGARLSCASFAGADLRAAKLAGAEMRFTDFGGAHLQCADFGRPRSHAKLAQVWAPSSPSFADAVLENPAAASRMDRGALAVVDAALDLTESPDDEITGLLKLRDWRPFSFGAVAVVRRGIRIPTQTHLLIDHLRGSPDVSAAAAVALMHTGYPFSDLAVLRPDLLERPLESGPYRDAPQWTKQVRSRLQNIEAWPTRR